MTSLARFRASSLVAVALVSGCYYGTEAKLYVDNGPAGGNTTGSGGAQSGSGGNLTGSGGISTGSGGAQSGSGGTPTGSGGITTDTGGAIGSGGMTTPGTGGTSTGSGGTMTTGAGGTSMSSGGTTGAGGASGGTTGMGGMSGWGTPVAGGPTGTGVTATVTVNPDNTVGTVGADFVGFSYEKTHITNGSLISTNTNLIALYKLLGKPVDAARRQRRRQLQLGRHGRGADRAVGAAVHEHHHDADASTSSAAFWRQRAARSSTRVNFKSNNVTASAAEATYVMSKCASSVYGFEIGNEIDKYGTWTSQQDAVGIVRHRHPATPGALLIGPAATGGALSSFTTPFAADRSRRSSGASCAS